MSLGYHLVQFVPDPFSQTVLTVGALVQVDSGWQFEIAPAGERVIPSIFPAAATTLYRALITELDGLTAPRLPLSLGPHLRLHERIEIPTGVQNPASWVVATVLPADPPAEAKARRRQRTRRSTVGKLFLREQGVSRLVKSFFKPEMVGAKPHTVRPISQYVVGSRESLLLEPLYLDSERFEDDLQDVTSTLLAWESVARHRRTANLKFSIYAIGNSTVNFGQLADSVSDDEIALVNTNVRNERVRFVETLRLIANEPTNPLGFAT